MAPVFDDNDEYCKYIDAEGNIIIDNNYFSSTVFTENGLAMVAASKNEDGSFTDWGIIDETGKEILPCKYTVILQHNNGSYVAMLDDETTLVDNRGKVLDVSRYDTCAAFGENGWAAVGLILGEENEDDYLWEFLDAEGNIMLEVSKNYEEIENFVKIA